MSAVSLPSTMVHISDTVSILLLAFAGGFVDAAGYLKLFGLFTSSITGNLVVICASVSSTLGLVARSTCALSFLLSAFLLNSTFQYMKIKYKASHNACLIVAYNFEFIPMLAAMIIGLLYDDEITNGGLEDSMVVLVGCLLGASMGSQCVAARESFTNCPPTTVMTNTLVNVTLLRTITTYFLFSSSYL